MEAAFFPQRPLRRSECTHCLRQGKPTAQFSPLMPGPVRALLTAWALGEFPWSRRPDCDVWIQGFPQPWLPPKHTHTYHVQTRVALLSCPAFAPRVSVSPAPWQARAGAVSWPETTACGCQSWTQRLLSTPTVAEHLELIITPASDKPAFPYDS